MGLQISLYTCGSVNEKDSLKHRSYGLHTQREILGKHCYELWRSSAISQCSEIFGNSLQAPVFSQCLGGGGATHCSWLWLIKDSFKNKGSFIVLVELFFKDGGLLLSIFLPFPLFISSVLHSLALLPLTSYKHTHPLAIESFIWTTGSMLYISVLDHNWDENILRSWLLCSTIQVLYWTLIEKYEQHSRDI